MTQNQKLILRDDREGTLRPVLMDIALWGDESTIRIFSERGEQISIDWGFPDEDGWFTPTFTILKFEGSAL